MTLSKYCNKAHCEVGKMIVIKKQKFYIVWVILIIDIIPFRHYIYIEINTIYFIAEQPEAAAEALQFHLYVTALLHHK